ncbi:restriction endonuclease subunit S [Pseudoalteromonas sp. Ld20]|uniref:restriction endonuclease subunit S n=1 Tax=Pseudoalteromonas sp. Ld20 TaxID=649165 RepID=UPI00386E58AC
MSWSLVKLGDICTTTQGVQITKANTKAEPYQGGYRYLYIADFMSEKKLSFVDDEFDHKKVTSNDLVMANTGSPGRVFKGKDGILSNNLFKISFDNNSVDRDYLYMMLSSNVFQSLLQKQMKGGIQKHLGHQTISRQEIPLPPLEEQKRIAAILDKADTIRRKRQQAIQLADEFLRSVFLDMFGDPVTNPKGWEVNKLGELIIKGPTNGLYKPASDYGSGARILRIDGFYDGVLSDQSKLKRVKVTDAEMDKFGLSERSIVINRVNSKEYLGKCGFAQHLEESTVFESNMMNFKVDETKLNSRFLVQQLQMPNIKMQIATCSKDAVNQSSINQNDVKSFEIIVPTIELQNEYENVCKRYLASKLNYDDSSNLNSELFNSLSQKAFAGEL